MGIKSRLSLLTFLQFAVWGSYLVSLGQYLGSSGLGREIQWFYAVGGFAALFMPALMGAVADRYVQAQKLLGTSAGFFRLYAFLQSSFQMIQELLNSLINCSVSLVLARLTNDIV